MIPQLIFMQFKLADLFSEMGHTRESCVMTRELIKTYTEVLGETHESTIEMSRMRVKLDAIRLRQASGCEDGQEEGSSSSDGEWEEESDCSS